MDRWPDGVRWVDLAATDDQLVVPELVAGALGLLLADGAVPSLARQIGDRRMLVCLDNCEHVLAAAADVVVTLARACPHVTVLATSREPLGVAGELVWRVPSLGGEDAVALFAARSAQVAGSDEARARCGPRARGWTVSRWRSRPACHEGLTLLSPVVYGSALRRHWIP